MFIQLIKGVWIHPEIKDYSLTIKRLPGNYTVGSPFSLLSLGHQSVGTKGAEVACRTLYKALTVSMPEIAFWESVSVLVFNSVLE